MSIPFGSEKVWLKKHKYEEAERIYYESLAKGIQPVPYSLGGSNKEGHKAEVKQEPPLAQDKVWLNKSKYSEAEKTHYENLEKALNDLLTEEKVAGVHKRKYNEVDKDPNEVEEKVKLIHPLGEESWQKEKADKYNGLEKSPGKRDSPSRLKNEKYKLSRNRRKSKGHSLSESSNPEEKLCFTAPPKSLPVEVVTQTETEKQFSVETQTPPPTQLTQPIIQPSLAGETKKKKKSKWKSSHKTKTSVEEKPVQGNTPNNSYKTSFASEVAKARQHIKSSLECIDGIEEMASKKMGVDLTNRINQLEKEKNDLKQQLTSLQDVVKSLEARLSKLELGSPEKSSAPPKAQPPAQSKADDDDDGVDLFGSDSEEDEEAIKVKEARLAAYAAKKSKKPALIAKSSIILDVKPWDDETDMKLMEDEVRKIATDGLLWGASKLVPLAYGIRKLQISCVVEDEKVSVDWLQETIQEIEDYVQSVDIAAFNKI